jgi:hypothetical protein
MNVEVAVEGSTETQLLLSFRRDEGGRRLEGLGMEPERKNEGLEEL